MLKDKLIPKLRDRYPRSGARFGEPPEPIAVFPAHHAAVGDLSIYDDGDEITIVAGRFTHGHFACYDQGISDEQWEARIVDDALRFLDRMFADQVVLWGSHDGRGGWYVRDRADVKALARPGGNLFVWSGPLPSG